MRDFFDGPRARAAAPRPSGAGTAAPCASTSLQPDDVKQANRLINELQGAKLIRNDKRRAPGTFERFLLAGHAAAIAPVGANGDVAYAAAMQARKLREQRTRANNSRAKADLAKPKRRLFVRKTKKQHRKGAPVNKPPKSSCRL